MTILNLGCITQEWRVPLGDQQVSAVLGYANAEDYRHNPAFMGAIVGRVANRIRDAAFQLDGQSYALSANEGAHMLHGGPLGLSQRFWDMEADAGSVLLRLRSEDGDQGFPGTVDFEVRISLNGDRLTYDMTAAVDRPTPIALAQHNYYALGASQGMQGASLQINADHTTPTDADMIPNGDITPVSGTRFDFAASRSLHDADPDGQGYDQNYVLNAGTPAARIQTSNGLCLELETDQPGLQLYSAQHLSRVHAPLPGQEHGPYAGLCLEPQTFPNAINTASFGNIITTPDAPYHQRLSVRIFVQGPQ